jgi:hypothetical protein
MEALKQTQSDRMGKWRKEAEAMCDWLDAMEDQLESLHTEGGNKDIKDVYKHLEECEVHCPFSILEVKKQNLGFVFFSLPAIFFLFSETT